MRALFCVLTYVYTHMHGNPGFARDFYLAYVRSLNKSPRLYWNNATRLLVCRNSTKHALVFISPKRAWQSLYHQLTRACITTRSFPWKLILEKASGHSAARARLIKGIHRARAMRIRSTPVLTNRSGGAHARRWEIACPPLLVSTYRACRRQALSRSPSPLAFYDRPPGARRGWGSTRVRVSMGRRARSADVD